MDHLQAWSRFKDMTLSDMPDDVVKVAKHCLLDWYGCALAGSREPLSELLREAFNTRSGVATVIGSELKLDAPTAALLNGAAGHALDYDDTGLGVGCHSTAPVLPAVLAVAEEIGASNDALLASMVVGVEIQGRIHHAMGSDHYTRGWHTTATYGTFGATAAVAHLLNLDAEQYGVAMGLAASHASGVKANFGTMTKPYHAGRSAEGGVNSARLAARGFTANPAAVSGNQGYIGAASNAKAVEGKLEQIADDWLILRTLFKYHAACHLTHAGIESIGRLKKQHEAGELSALTITVHPSILNVCGIPEPKTGLEGKFSLRGTASLVLNNIDTSNPETYVDSVISSESVQSMIDKVTIETDEGLTAMQSRVVWTDRNQQSYEAFHDTGIPATDLEDQEQKLEQKFVSLCDFAKLESSVSRQRVNELMS